MASKEEEQEFQRVANNFRTFLYDQILPLFVGLNAPPEAIAERRALPIEEFIEGVNNQFMSLIAIDAMLRSNNQVYQDRHKSPLVDELRSLYNEENEVQIDLMTSVLYGQIMVCIMTHLGTLLRIAEQTGQAPDWINSASLPQILGTAQIPLPLKRKALNYLMYMINSHLVQAE